MEIDKTGLEDRFIDVFLNSTNERGYLFVTNMETKVTRWSLNAVEYFEMPGEYVYDMDSFWEKRIHPDDLTEYQRKLANVFSGRHEWEYFEYRILNSDGEYVVCTCKCTIAKGKDGEPDIFSGTIVNRGIGEIIDPVTLLNTNQRFVEHLEQIVRARWQAVVMDIEISKFSRISVLYGYEAGEQVLLGLANLIRGIVGDRGRAYHLDGAKFVPRIPEMKKKEADDCYD